MILTNQSKKDFNLLTSAKKPNKRYISHKYLSKDKHNVVLNKNNNVISKESVLNEKLPIKVNIINEPNLSSKIHLTRLHKKNKSAQNFKIKNNPIHDNKGDINKLNNLLISSKIIDDNENFNKLLNIKNILEKNYYYNKNNVYKKINFKPKDDYIQNYTSNNPIEENRLNSSYSMTKNSNHSTNILYTENYSSTGMSSDNIFTNYAHTGIVPNSKIKIIYSTSKINQLDDLNNQNDYKIKVSKKNENKNKNYMNNLQAYIQKNNEGIYFSKRNNTPVKIKNYKNNSFNITNNNYNYIYLSPKKKIINSNLNYDNIEIKLEDLILFDKRLNDIYISLNNKNIYERGPLNECKKFISFYFFSSLKGAFPHFFDNMYKIIIKSSINLKLFSCVLTYHISLNRSILAKLVNQLKNIFSLLQINLYMLIRKIQLFYGEKYVKQNEIYFQNFNYILIKNGIFKFNESQIVKIIKKNCYEIVKNINNILIYYKSLENKYYLDFFEIFDSISIISELEIYNYFYSHILVNSSKSAPKPKYFPIKPKSNLNINMSENSESKKLENANKIDYKSYSKSKEKEIEIKTILKYHKYKILPPFLKKPNKKKYSLVIGLEETIININEDRTVNIRPRLYLFFEAIKPYYEIISFTNESKYFSDSIIKIIDPKNKYFDYNMYREHLTFDGKEFVVNISKLGRDIKKVIVVDNNVDNYKLNPENGIQIKSYLQHKPEDDEVLLALENLLISFYKSGYDDLRIAIKKNSKDINKNITKNIDK